MYFPYLRGRQNELLCLRELLDAGKLEKTIVPVIEPVRFNSTFFSTLSKFIEADRDVVVIHNPKVGKFNKEYSQMEEKIEKEADENKKEKFQKALDENSTLLNEPHVIEAYICDKETLNKCIKRSIDVENIILINNGTEFFNTYEENGQNLNAKFTFIPKDEDFRDEVFGDAVVLQDCYNKAKRNIDYIASPDEAYSRNHLIFQKRGYKGFSDYSIVGDVYEESGFAPLAVAIHILYFGKKGELRVHHFVSESNENTSDPARKFEEAMSNLIGWEYFDNITKTYGLSCLINYYENGKFPGLGVIKKCSLMHHLELIGNYLEEK